MADINVPDLIAEAKRRCMDGTRGAWMTAGCRVIDLDGHTIAVMSAPEVAENFAAIRNLALKAIDLLAYTDTGAGRGVMVEVASERRHQMGDGYTAEHDDLLDYGELACAAAAYAEGAAGPGDYENGRFVQKDGTTAVYRVLPPETWPWGFDRWRPKNRRHDLIVAAALIVAEIERMDRQEGANV